MFDDEQEQDSRVETVYVEHEHRQCKYQNFADRCPGPAEVPTSKDKRRVEGRNGKVWVDIGYCGDHYHYWHETRDRKISDQVLYAKLERKGIRPPCEVHELVKERMRTDPVCRMMSQYPPRGIEAGRQVLATLLSQFGKRPR